jgi:hypothetical protein
VGDVNGREGGRKGTTSGGGERMVEDQNGSAEKTWKRALACSILEERPKKRSERCAFPYNVDNVLYKRPKVATSMPTASAVTPLPTLNLIR